MSKLLAIVGAVAAGFALASADQFDDPVNGNPLVPGYFADPCVRKFGDTYYLYATPDGWGFGQGRFCIWTSKDFVHWTAHKSNWPTTDWKWAPSVVHANGKYYMFTQVPCQVWVGVADTPLGPWKNPIPGGGPMILDGTPQRTITLDGECFINTDGKAYLLYGTWWTPTIMKLNPDLVSWSEKPIQYFSRQPGYTPPNGTVKGCMEAPFMLKRNGTYYYMYSDFYCANSTYCVEYSTGATPLGPWTYGAHNPILSTNADNSVDGPGHHTVLQDGGRFFIVYHRHDNPHHPDGGHRQVAADELRFNFDGSIQKVMPTHRGIGYLAPSAKRDTNWVVDNSLHVTAKASSSAGPDFAPINAADENNGTLWKARVFTYPQWLQIDLGRPKSVKRIETEFQFAQVAYRYKIVTSGDGKSWAAFADRTRNRGWGPMIDSAGAPAKVRFVRVVMLGDDAPERTNPEIGIWNVKVYDGVDKPNQAPFVDPGPPKRCNFAFPTVPLHGMVTDDGLPFGPVKCTWSKASGPGSVSFEDPHSPDTTAHFGSAGDYVLWLTADDGALRTSKHVMVQVDARPPAKILSYSFEDAKGTRVTDTSGCARDGLVGSDGDMKKNPRHGGGVAGRALCLDGAMTYVAVPGLGEHRSLTVAAWIKLNGLPEQACVFAGNGDAPGTPRFLVRGSGEIELSFAGAQPACRSAFRFTERTVGRWTHVAAIYDGAAETVTFYVDGRAEHPRKLATSVRVRLGAGARVGASDHPGGYFDGKIDELNVYGVALSRVAVAALAKAAPRLTVRDAKRLPAGRSITLTAVPVVYAPRGDDLSRTTDFFYIADPSGAAAMKVVDGRAGRDDLEEDRGATLTGLTRIDPATGEPILELTGMPENESAPVVSPFQASLAQLHRDFRLIGSGKPVTVKAVVASIAADRRSMVLSDGQARLVQVRCESDPVSRSIVPGNVVSVVGVLCKTGTSRIMLLTKRMDRITPPVDPMTFELQSRLVFEEGSGAVAADSSGNGRAATILGAKWAPGEGAPSLRFNGETDYLSIPDMGTFKAVTISGWICPRILRPWQAIVHCDGFDPRDTHLSLQEDGALFFSVDQNVPVDVRSAPLFSRTSIDTWKHFAVVYDSRAKVVRFYGDGALLSTAHYSVAVPAGWVGGIKVGSWNGRDRFFDGKLRDLRFYGRALSDAEIQLVAKGLHK